MKTRMTILFTSGNWEPDNPIILSEGSDTTEGVQIPALTEGEFYTTLAKVSRRLEPPVGENIRSTVQALKGTRRKSEHNAIP